MLQSGARAAKAGRSCLIAACLGTLMALAGCSAVIVDDAPHGSAEKVRICHKGKKTLEVAEAAVDAHLKHGDRLGACR